MGLFKRPTPSLPDFFEAIKSPLPIEHVDISKRYDLYCYFAQEVRLYENIKITALRTLEDIPRKSRSLIGAFLEIEAPDGTRIMIPKLHVHAICEHGVQPSYKVLRTLGAPEHRPA